MTHTSVMMLETIKNIGLAFISATPLLVCGAYCHCERLWREDCASRLRTSSLSSDAIDYSAFAEDGAQASAQSAKTTLSST